MSSAEPGRLGIGIDIGGTKVAGGVVDARRHRAAPGPPGHPAPFQEPGVVEDTIVEVVEELVAIVAGGGCGRGRHRRRRLRRRRPGHRRLRPAPVVARTSRCEANLQRRVPVPIFVDNDANAAAWAEWRFGAAQGETPRR